MALEIVKRNHLRIAGNILLGVTVYLVLVFALVEVESISRQSALTNFSNAFWYSIVTLTTVGYGDLYPSTTYGRVIGYIFVLCSLIFYGLLVGSFTSFIANLKENKKLGHSGTNFTNHAVIIGWNDYGHMVTDQLLGVGKKVAIVTNDRTHLDFIHERYNSKNIFTLYNDFKNFDLLKKANIEASSIVFVNLEDDTEKLVYILNIKKVYPDLDFVVNLDNSDLKNTFLAAGVTNTISKHEISSKLLASYMFEPDVASFSESIMSFAQSDSDYDIKQFLVTPTNPFAGKTYNDLFFALKSKYNTILLGITKRDKFGKRRLLKNPVGDIKVMPGDYVLVIVNGKAFKLLRRAFKVEEGYIRETEDGKEKNA
jgi:voltage-gated potassium channel